MILQTFITQVVITATSKVEPLVHDFSLQTWELHQLPLCNHKWCVEQPKSALASSLVQFLCWQKIPALQMPGHVTALAKFPIGQRMQHSSHQLYGWKKIHQPAERVKAKNPILPTLLLWKTLTLDMIMNNFLLAAILFVVLLEPNYLSLLSIRWTFPIFFRFNRHPSSSF